MKLWIERALAALRWGWEKFVALAKIAFAKLQVIFSTVYDPPPKTIRFWFWSWAAMVAIVWIAFAFTNSWFYKPTAAYFTSIFEDGDVLIPDQEHELEWARGVIKDRLEQMPSVATPAVEVPSVEVVCHDMSDTPHCEPVKDLTPEVKKEVSEIPLPVAKPKATTVKSSVVRRKARKHKPYVTYWGF